MAKDLSHIPTAMMEDDLAISKMELETCEKLLPGATTEKERARLQERIDGNRQIIAVIEAELAKRREE